VEGVTAELSGFICMALYHARARCASGFLPLFPLDGKLFSLFLQN
jgi:hypothetical protein